MMRASIYRVHNSMSWFHRLFCRRCRWIHAHPSSWIGYD